MAAEQTTNIKVAVRVRPYNRRELEQNQRCIVKVVDSTSLLFDPDDEDDEFFFQGTKQNYRDITKRTHKKLSMEFDRVFDTDATNNQIFEECTAPLVDAVLNGYNCSVFVYGATGAGKTFTMLGSDSFPGLTFLTMRDLFQKIHSQSNIKKFDIGVSYLEVYNEQVMNLLTKTGPLRLREDSNGVVVSGLVLKPIYSAAELLDLLALGNSNRTQHPTDANAESSRSHAVFQVHIRMVDRKTGTKRMVKLSMIDLAGSERAASTKGIGLRFKEGASINKSLLALGNCINKLADGLKHIPYRDSNLTRILKDSLGGNCCTLMVANISMSSLTYEDTYNTLKYASRAKKIRTILRQNALKSNMPKEFYFRKVNELTAAYDLLKEVNKELEAKVAQLQKAAASAPPTSETSENELMLWYSKMDAVYSSVVKAQEYVIGLQSKIKNINFRKKIKDDAELSMKILNIHLDLQEQNSSAQKSRLDKQIELHIAELARWRKKQQDAYKDLEKLKNEIKGSQHVNILQIYQKSKDLEVQNSKKDIIINHISSIDSELAVNSHKLKQALTMACEMIQKGFTAQTAGVKLDQDSHNSFEQLQRLISASGSTYQNSLHKIIDHNLGLGDVESLINSSNIITTSDEEDASSTTSSTVKRIGKKRTQLESKLDSDVMVDEIASTSGSLFKMPKMPPSSINLDETNIVSTVDYGCNSTFDLGNQSDHSNNATHLTSTVNNTAKATFVQNVVSELVVRAPANKEQIRRALLKSNNFTHQSLQKTVAIGIEKENKKYAPNRVRKSPRAALSSVLATTASSLRKQTHKVENNKLGGDSNEPIVRINRAASFRIRK